MGNDWSDTDQPGSVPAAVNRSRAMNEDKMVGVEYIPSYQECTMVGLEPLPSYEECIMVGLESLPLSRRGTNGN